MRFKGKSSKLRKTLSSLATVTLVCQLLLMPLVPVTAATATPTITVTGAPATVNSGAVTDFTYTITNTTASSYSDLTWWMDISNAQLRDLKSFSYVDGANVTPVSFSDQGNVYTGLFLESLGLPLTNSSTLPVNGTMSFHFRVAFNNLGSSPASHVIKFGSMQGAGSAFFDTTATFTVSPPTSDTTAPEISIIGTNPVTVPVGAAYTDAGAFAIDNIDGSITSRIVTTGSVNTAVPGTYAITYSVSDVAGNSSTATRTVNVVVIHDTVAPVIIVKGQNPTAVTLGSVYLDAGATATDNIDGNITAKITTTSTVNTAALGIYAVTYSVTDLGGNTATKTRTVNVVPVPDTTAPVISLNGVNPVQLTVGDTYIEAGATATDNVDPVVNVMISGAVNTANPGTYIIYYDATDTAGNTATVTRTVNVAPGPVAPMPVFTVVGAPATVANGARTDFSYTITNPTTVSYSDLTWWMLIDNARLSDIKSFSYVDGNTVTPITFTEQGNGTTGYFLELIGLPLVDSSLLDSNGTVTYQFQVTFSNNGVSPVSHAITFGAMQGAQTVFSDSTAVFGVDPVVVGPDTTPPVITVLGTNPDAVTVGDTYIDAGATATDDVDPTVTVVTTGTVDTSVVGTYTIAYTATDVAGNTLTEIRTVDVVAVLDTTAPVITITGANPATVIVGGTYTDAGATAFDDVDGDITSQILTTSTVDVTTVGTYTVTYTVSDLAGNTASEVRTVDVVAAPVVYKVGDINHDGLINGMDYTILLLNWGKTSGPADINLDGIVNGMDYTILLLNWGK